MITFNFPISSICRKALIERCEQVVLDIIQSLAAGENPKISYKVGSVQTLIQQSESLSTDFESTENSTETPESQNYESYKSSSSTTDESQDLERGAQKQKTVVNFSYSRSKPKLALMLVILAKIHLLLINGRTETRRSLYYELKSNEETLKIVKSQRQIDRLVNHLANLLDCAPWEMGLLATSKGLAAGDLSLIMNDTEKVDFTSSGGGVLIPQTIGDVTTIRTTAYFVIVVEKDTIFQTLLMDKCPERLNCILITGKGFPDVATRRLIKLLAEKAQLPVYILVDADPYGIEIFFTYK